MTAAAPLEGPADNEILLARRLGGVDATLIVMGGIIGSGIFVTPRWSQAEYRTHASS